MILAAGEGRRMRPLTLTTPKPLLMAGNKPLIEYHINNLTAAGIQRIVINVAYLGQKIIDFVGDGSRYGVSIDYSIEPEPLETAGAIGYALPLLGDTPFVLVNGDVWSDYPLVNLTRLDTVSGAHLVMVKNPLHHHSGDYGVSDGVIVPAQQVRESVTFSGLSVIAPSAITAYPKRRLKFPLREVFNGLMEQRRLTGEVYAGEWRDIGTPERLALLDQQLARNSRV
jgi:Nucleoside-diphosphate-sugar pyrophosphorylase involved in lipopolysaccharide biosynthesis/translation initiation factor 2B, gamma/epsilon subunits (eIF-2Bgamma/eIF-2Bepsilon)